MKIWVVGLIAGLSWFGVAASAGAVGSFDVSKESNQSGDYGIQLKCRDSSSEQGSRAMEAYLAELRVKKGLWSMVEGKTPGVMTYRLTTAGGDTSTLDLLNRPEYWVMEEKLRLTGGRVVSTVTEKEIVLSMMQRGRLQERIEAEVLKKG